MIFVKCSLPSKPTTSPMPGAKSSTRLWGIVPSTSSSTSSRVYLSVRNLDWFSIVIVGKTHPTAFKPRGISSSSRNRAMDSNKCLPISESEIREIEGSEIVVLLKIAKISRWRSGAEGAVNWKTFFEITSCHVVSCCSRNWLTCRTCQSDAERNDECTVISRFLETVCYLTPCGMMGPLTW